ncbi:MAG: adenylate/guanylate cyclase domain-containing protein [Candidatus Rokubacteria bacterium]|nr:adenylate/guanylate cyclase domain-containing protein [Candidatus Rokubacteria bacterium]
MSRPGAWWKRRRRRLLRLWAIGIGASLVVTAISASGLLDAQQARALDLLLKLRGQSLVSSVVVVAVDDDAFRGLGERQPLDREYLARVVHGARRAGASAVALDIAFSTPSPKDGALADAIVAFSDAGLSRVVLTHHAPPEGPLAELSSRVKVLRGSPDVPEESDGLVRRTSLVMTGRGGDEPSLALATIARARGVTPEFVARQYDAAPGRLIHVNFAGPAQTFLTIPSDVVAALASDTVELPPDNPLRGRLVFVGGTFRESRDFFATAHGRLAGVEIHANIAHMVVTGNFIRPAGRVLGLVLQLAAVLVAGVVMVTAGAPTSALLCGVAPFVLALPASYLAFNSGGYWVDFVLPVVATRVLGAVGVRVERHRIDKAFGRYVSKEVATEVMADAPSLAGENREVSILFSDIRGFTTISEKRPPAELAAQLNEYFEAMTAAIFRHRGMVNDFIGDAVFGIFGAPVRDPDHAWHAVAAADAMERALQELNVKWEKEGQPLLHMGVGVHTGIVFAGNVGGRTRFKYTLIGDAVNLASRVEGVNKELGTTILLTEATHARVAARVRARDCGPVPVKGRNEPVRVFELLGLT